MSVEPIGEAETILASAIRDALAPIAQTYNERPKIYWLLGEQGAPKPFLVAQPQTPIERQDWIGAVGATAQITLKALATSAKEARELLAAAWPAMFTLTYDGYTLTTRYLRSPIIPPLQGTYQSAHTFQISIERNS